MGATKKHFYNFHQLKLAELYKALGHPARISIVEQLIRHPDSNCTAIEQSLQLSKSTVSKHLQVLHNAGVTGYEVINNSCFYRVSPEAIEFLSDNLRDLERQVDISGSGPNVYWRRL